MPPKKQRGVVEIADENSNLPDSIFVSGMSILLAAWNGEYKRVADSRRYARASHSFWGIPISASYIDFDGDWILFSEGFSGRKVFDRQAQDLETGPLGVWASGITVCAEPHLLTDWIRSYGAVSAMVFTALSFAMFTAIQIVPRVLDFARDHAYDEFPAWQICICFFLLWLAKKMIC